ncbi:MAG: hypothetical protein F4Z80_07050 [Chloroflexi bacterium]|nr:hypothetical protein [Chloroflexota bacterium]MYC47041.1 hypothetical protein [Chloroflexota bacterium]
MSNQDIVEQVLQTLNRRYTSRIMENVVRGDYVECLIAHALGFDWELTWASGWGWAAWDIEHVSGARIEVKQSAARQTWDQSTLAPTRPTRFDIAPRSGYWIRDGSRYFEFPTPSRAADLYVFAWHAERRLDRVDHREPAQWQFFVVPERKLPEAQKTIGLAGIRQFGSPCGLGGLRDAVKTALPDRAYLKNRIHQGWP